MNSLITEGVMSAILFFLSFFYNSQDGNTHTHTHSVELAAAPAFSHAQVAGLGRGLQPGAQCGVSSSALFQLRLGAPLSSLLADGGGLGSLGWRAG